MAAATALRPQPDDDAFALACSQTATLGEGLQWHAASGCWWWTDISSATLHSWSPALAAPHMLRLPDRLGSFAHCRSGRLLLGLAKRLALAELPAQIASSATLLVRPLAAVDAAEARTRINDGRTDRAGNFVFGTLNEAPEGRPIGSFYQYAARHGLRRLALPAVTIANSICFSLDGKTMYFTDTPTRRILQCDYDAESAQVADVRLFADVDRADAFPDGSVVDRDGCLWNAQWGASRVVCYDPSGAPVRVVAVPVPQPTCPAFGGADWSELMVTSARQSLEADELAHRPMSGSLFRLRLDRPTGVADALFDDTALAA